MFQIRTDLAMETSEDCQKAKKDMRGISVEQKRVGEDIVLTKVKVETENGAKQMGKPKGTYITIESDKMTEQDEGYHRDISRAFSQILTLFLPKKRENLKVLVAGLGNREVTPDALGPQVVDHLFVPRLLLQEFGHYLIEFENGCSVSGIVPGVMAQTGMESVEIMRGIVKETNPDIVIVIDALAARNVKRLNRTIQITDTGIVPGSGVGNHRNAINRANLGVPVIAVGIPTVVDAATIVADTFVSLVDIMEKTKQQVGLKEPFERLNEAEREELVRELISPKMNTMYVTPKDIDEEVRRLSFTISEGLNMTFVPGDPF